MVSRMGMIPEAVLKKSGVWEAMQAMSPTADTVRDAFDRVVALDERGTMLTKSQAEMLDQIKKLQASGLQIRTAEQLHTLLKGARKK